jgi:hypothetical protein
MGAGRNQTAIGRLRESQIIFRTRCNEVGAPHELWRSVDDILAWIAKLNRRA